MKNSFRGSYKLSRLKRNRHYQPLKTRKNGPTQIDYHLSWVRKVQRRAYSHADPIVVNFGRKSRPDFNSHAQSRPCTARNRTYTLRTVSRWAKKTRLGKVNIWKLAGKELDRTGMNWVFLTGSSRTREGWNFEIMCKLQKTQCCNYSWFVCSSKDGPMQRTPRRLT